MSELLRRRRGFARNGVAGAIAIMTGMSPVANAEGGEGRLTYAYVSNAVAVARERFAIPAIAVAVMSAEAIPIFEIQGVRVHGQPAPALLDDYFHIGSCSKSVLAVMAARLVAQHKLSWDTRFFDLFPELKELSVEAYRDITLEDLLLCRAGIRAFTYLAAEPLPEYGPEVGDPRLAFIQQLIQWPPSSKKGKDGFAFLYSNASYTMASAMIERAAGFSYEELVARTLTDELGLAVAIGWPNRIGPNQPWGHMVAKRKVTAFPPDHEYSIPCLLTPAGDLSMPARDYAAYTQLHLRGLRGKSDCLSADMFQRLHFGRPGFSLGMANGVMGGHRYSGFDGSAGTFFCRSILVPESDFAFCILMNAGSGSAAMPAVEWLTMRLAKRRYHWWWKFWL